MKQKKYTKNQLVEAFETFKESNRIIKDICQSVEPVVENAVKACVEKARDIQFCKDADGNFLTLKKAVAIVSPLFKSFIELYFVDEHRLATVRKSELTKEEIEDGQWDVIMDFRHNGDAESLHACLDVDALDGATERLRLEAESEDIADIYNAEDFTVSEEDGDIIIHAGEVQLIRLKLTPETE